MDTFAQLNSEERRVYFEQAAARRKMSPQIIEKDFWVCWTLRQLFALPEISSNLIFKGGTSLAKIFRIIERFSEDIDISIDRGFLGFGGDQSPEAGNSNKERQRRIDALKTACQEKIKNHLYPSLNALVQSKIKKDESWLLQSDPNDPDRQTLLFEYPQVFPKASNTYIRREVKIEMGARADHWPCEIKPITPYVAEQFPKAFREASFPLKVLSVERTFWEKATILHAEYHRPTDKSTPARLSRHYSDFYDLIQKSSNIHSMTTQSLGLLDDVARHKSLFFKSSWAKYKDAVKGTLRIVPPKHRLISLHDDYEAMKEMFFGDIPDFETILSTLKKWESDFNK